MMNSSRIFRAITVAGALMQSLLYAADKPNVVIMLADDLGYNDLGCYGSPDIKTPNIDGIAKAGIKFTDFYTAPACTPSRAALMTGCYPQRLGFGSNLGNVNGKISPSGVLHPNSPFGLNLDEVTIPEVLKTAGYATGMIGKWHLGDAEKFNPVHQGFDFYFGVPYSNDMKPFYFLSGTKKLEEPAENDNLTQRYTAEAVKFIDANYDKPFFLYVAHNAPHTPLGASAAFKGKSARGLYGDAVEEVDWCAGQVMETLKKHNLLEKTLVIFFSDNGPWLPRGEDGGSATPLRNGKGSTYEGGMREPCVMQWPGVIPAGSVCHEAATNMDFLPTLAKLAGAEVKTLHSIDGKDISALIKGEAGAKTPHEAIFYYFGSQAHAVRSGIWKYRAENTVKNEDIYRKNPPEGTMPEALYNLERDPGEQKNVIKDHPKIANRLRDLLEGARGDLGDSLTSRTGTGLRKVGE